MDNHNITGWTANQRFMANGRRYDIDVAFRKQKLAVEIDGYATHGDRDAFEHDRQRQNDLVAAGWTVLRFTWAMLNNPEQVVGLVRTTLRRLDRTGQSRSQIRIRPANPGLGETNCDFVPSVRHHPGRRNPPSVSP